jgi:hypothetical protein
VNEEIHAHRAPRPRPPFAIQRLMKVHLSQCVERQPSCQFWPKYSPVREKGKDSSRCGLPPLDEIGAEVPLLQKLARENAHRPVAKHGRPVPAAYVDAARSLLLLRATSAPVRATEEWLTSRALDGCAAGRRWRGTAFKLAGGSAATNNQPRFGGRRQQVS